MSFISISPIWSIPPGASPRAFLTLRLIGVSEIASETAHLALWLAPVDGYSESPMRHDREVRRRFIAALRPSARRERVRSPDMSPRAKQRPRRSGGWKSAYFWSACSVGIPCPNCHQACKVNIVEDASHQIIIVSNPCHGVGDFSI